MKYKFNILKDGVEEPWSGSFESEMKAQEWYENFGKKKEAEGFELIKVNYAKSISKKISEANKAKGLEMAKELFSKPNCKDYIKIADELYNGMGICAVRPSESKIKVRHLIGV